MKKVTAEVIEKNRYLVTVEVEDNATDGDIYDAIVRAYIGDDTYMGDSCKVIEQYIYDVTNIKVKESGYFAAVLERDKILNGEENE